MFEFKSNNEYGPKLQTFRFERFFFLHYVCPLQHFKEPELEIGQMGAQLFYGQLCIRFIALYSLFHLQESRLMD